MKIKLLVRDEVNCTFNGIDVAHRRVLTNKFKVEVPGARYSPAVKLGRWDGKISFFSLAGGTYINLLPEILPMLDTWGYDIEVEDARVYRTNFKFEHVDETTFANKKWPKGHLMEGEPVVLRDYQIEHINKFLDDPQCMQEIATGAGKTLITAALSQRCEQYGRTIVIVPNKTLVGQTEADYINLGLNVGVYFGDRKEYNCTHTICTWQSLNNMMKNTVKGEAEVEFSDFIDNVVCVMVDEVHAAKAAALRTLLTGPMSHLPIRWGLTGTIPKDDHDRIILLTSIGPVVGTLAAHSLQEQGVLSNCHVNIVQLIDHAEHRDYQSELKYLTSTVDRVEFIGKLIKGISESGNTLVLVDRIATGKLLQDYLSGIFSTLSDKPDVSFVSGSMKAVERKDNYDDIAAGTNQIMIATYGVAAVGINIVRLHNVVLIEAGKSFVRTIQSIGRGLRKGGDKDHVDIWDITSSCKFSKSHLTKRKAFYKAAKYPSSIEKLEWKT